MTFVDIKDRELRVDGTMVIDTNQNASFQNVRIDGVVLSAWSASYRVIEWLSGSIMGGVTAGSPSYIAVQANTYYTGSGYFRRNTGAASVYYQSGGVHGFQTTISGAAGSSVVSWTLNMEIIHGQVNIPVFLRVGSAFLNSTLHSSAQMSVAGPNYALSSARGQLVVVATDGAGLADYGGTIILGGPVSGVQHYSFGYISGKKASGYTYAGYLSLGVSLNDSGNHGEGIRIHNTLQVRIPYLAGVGNRTVMVNASGDLYA